MKFVLILNSDLINTFGVPSHNVNVVTTNYSTQRISAFLKILNVNVEIKALAQFTDVEVLYTAIKPANQIALRVPTNTGKIVSVYLKTDGTLMLNTAESSTAFSVQFQLAI